MAQPESRALLQAASSFHSPHNVYLCGVGFCSSSAWKVSQVVQSRSQPAGLSSRRTQASRSAVMSVTKSSYSGRRAERFALDCGTEFDSVGCCVEIAHGVQVCVQRCMREAGDGSDGVD